MSIQTVDVFDLRADTGPPLHLYAWVWGVLTFGVGDLVTTGVAIAKYGAVESNPLPAMVLDAWGSSGFVALVALKLVAFGVCYAVYRSGPPLYRTGVPLGLAVLGTVIVAWNLGIIYLLVAGGL